jgi:hypothetical protein
MNHAAEIASFTQRLHIANLWDAMKGGRDRKGLARWLRQHYGVARSLFLSAEKADNAIAALEVIKNSSTQNRED